MSIRLRAVAFAALFFIVGCSGGGGSVSGKVTLDGTLLSNGTVTFHPTGTGPTGIGTIGADGRYQITVGTAKSLPPGEYVVTVESFEAIEMGSKDSNGKLTAPKAPKRITPARYADKEQTEFKKTVTAGDNVLDLELKK